MREVYFFDILISDVGLLLILNFIGFLFMDILLKLLAIAVILGAGPLIIVILSFQKSTNL